LNVEVEAGGRRRVVHVERQGMEWLLTIEGRTMRATVSEVGGRWSLLIGPPEGTLAPADAPVSRSVAATGPAEAGRHDDGRARAEDVVCGFSLAVEHDVVSGLSRTAEQDVESRVSRTAEHDVVSGFSRTAAQGVVSGLSRTDGAVIRPLRSYEVSFAADADGGVVVFVEGMTVPIAVPDRRARVPRASRDGGAVANGPRTIVAPMPGRVVKVLVEPGQTVAARQPVVIIEAMKMENELRAPRAGTIGAVHASEGTSVDAHAVLVVLE
jgi:biotin carboxyl carrier protein